MGSDARIRFMVLGAAVVAASTGAFVMLNATIDDKDGGASPYWGLRLLPPGPAETGLPVIPVDVAADGSLVGRPDHLAWYRYCGRESAPGLVPDYEGDNTFTFYSNPERVRQADRGGVELWWRENLGAIMRAEDFPDLWMGAPAAWRSEGAEGVDRLTVVVIRVDPTDYPEPFRSEFVREGFLAAATMDMHFCCTAGYGETDSPKAYRDTRSADRSHAVVLDPCHDSRYDPRDVVLYDGPPREVGP